jgi:phosphatidylinositol-3-phosphatase
MLTGARARPQRALAAAALLAASFGCTRSRPADRCEHKPQAPVPLLPGPRAIRTVFLVVMENKNWSQVERNPSAAYLNREILPAASFARSYFNPPGNHPSESNYLWMEGGTNYGIRDDQDPAAHHLPYRDHLVSLLDRAGISWRSYQEGIEGTECPLASRGLYAAKHNPFVFFDDVTSRNDPRSPSCIRHVRPLPELARDLEEGSVARYNFITPDLCHDMHNDSGCATADQVKNGDDFLAQWVPRIRRSSAYARGGLLLITWDESEDGDHPIGLVALSPAAKGGGYANTVPYTHSSLLRSLQEIFGVGPLLCDAANATSMSDLFRAYP